MTREERNTKLKNLITCLKCEESGKECDANCHVQYEAGNMGEIIENLEAISKALEQESCPDAISRSDMFDAIGHGTIYTSEGLQKIIKALPPVAPQPKTGHCKDCKHFEYDKVAKVDGIPLIVAHEICNKWGDGCKTKEDGYCFLFEPQEREGKE